jgi:protein involved in polysaccharide export with SLBB domain
MLTDGRRLSRNIRHIAALTRGAPVYLHHVVPQFCRCAPGSASNGDEQRLMPINSRILCCSILVIPLLTACASVTESLPPAPQIGLGPPDQQPEYRLQPGDVIELHILSNPELNEQVVVAPDNRVTFQYAPGLVAGGHSLQQVTDSLNRIYQTTTKNDLQVVLRSQVGTRVYVTGEVQLPSEVVTNGQISALSAISRAGGFKITAHRSQVVLMRRDEQNNPHLYALDLLAAMKGKDPKADVLLQPYDVLYVPRDRLSNASLVLERIRNAVPMGVNYGFYTSIAPPN